MTDPERTAAADAPARRLLRAAPSVVFYAVAVCAAWFLWPSSLGGCTTLTIVSGHSMEPTYYTGDIVVARCGEPEVGDVVVYEPEGMGGARIIHRITGGDGSQGWTIQGDNNASADPFTPTDDDVLGVARVHLPKVGLAASVLTNAWVWVSLIVLALALLVWPSAARADDGDDDGGDDGGDDAAGGAADDALADGPADDALTVGRDLP